MSRKITGMKKGLLVLAVVAVGLLAVSCKKEDIKPEKESVPMTKLYLEVDCPSSNANVYIHSFAPVEPWFSFNEFLNVGTDWSFTHNHYSNQQFTFSAENEGSIGPITIRVIKNGVVIAESSEKDENGMVIIQGVF
jgi:hypothetical protein